MQPMFYSQAYLDAIWQATDWILQNLLTFPALLQLMIIVIVLASARLAARQLSLRLEASPAAPKQNGLRRFFGYMNVSRREVLFIALSIITLWSFLIIARAAQWPTTLLNVASSLMTAWGIIRIVSSAIRNHTLARWLAVVLWIVAALNILGWLDSVIGVLDASAMTLGSLRISVFGLIKGALLFALLLWLTGFIAAGLERALGRSQNLTPSQKVLFHKLVRFGLFGVAVVMGLNAIGIDLTALAVFSGALGIGIGIGLQKVFANLVSGFILLMDKSVKPGDVIAIGDTYGWVNRLGARYVSILTRDGKEHLIPNEHMITEKVENWSYSDTKIRVHVPVRVSYHADQRHAHDLMLEAVSGHPRVLKFPAPICCITGFGDHGVDHELRLWIDDPANGVTNIKSDIYYAIWDLFREAGIGIPLPQREVYLHGGGA